MTSSADARAKPRASSYDPNQPRDPRGRWKSSDKTTWTNLRSNDGSPASLPVANSDLASRRSVAKQSSRPSSRANSVGGQSVKSIPEEVAVQQGVSPVPPPKVTSSEERVRSPAPKSKSVEEFDISINDSPPQAKHGDLMDEMQNELNESMSVVSNSSSAVARVREVANGIIRSMGSNPWSQEDVANGTEFDSKEAHTEIPGLPFQSDVIANAPAQSVTAGEASSSRREASIPAVESTAQNNEPAVDLSTVLHRGEFEEFKQGLFFRNFSRSDHIFFRNFSHSDHLL